VLSIHAAPRSGTSWLGQIFNSHPDVAYRYQPLFSYGHKAAINADSSREEVEAFFRDIYFSSDELVMQRGRGRLGAVPEGLEKATSPTTLVWKEVRYHFVLPRLLEVLPDYRAVGIVRHPCAVINSFLTTPREWKPEWSADEEWRLASKKNQGRPEEYYGFERWKELAELFLHLEASFPRNFVLVRYEQLVADPIETVQELFAFVGLNVPAQTLAFIRHSQNGDETSHDHGVFKSPRVACRWREELPQHIGEAIYRELSGTRLGGFLAT
jgi:hypothetical protein